MTCKYEITPCLQRGLLLGRAGRMLRSDDSRPELKRGTRVILTEDDGSVMPRFRTGKGELYWIDLDRVMHSVQTRP